MRRYPALSTLIICMAVLSGCRHMGFDNLEYVNSLIGTQGEGSQYGGMMPLTGVPFGSAQWVPMTRLTEVGILSYNESDSLLLGFIGTRQPAIWMGEWGQVSFQPQLGNLEMDYALRGQRIATQEYTPYEGKVEAGGIVTRYAALAHSSIFGISEADHIVIDASRITCKEQSDPGVHPGHIEFSKDKRSVSGWNEDRFDAHHTSPKPGFRGYFYMEFSRPFDECGVIGDGGDETRGFVSFTGKTRPLTVRVGLSLISIEQARANMEVEVGGKSISSVANMARTEWADKFATIDIEAPEDVKTIFYTGIYHSLLYPRDITEYGRYYSAFDDSVHTGKMYNCWSMWDTYRAEHPLLTLIAPERVDAMMQSLVEMYHEGGWLPKWPNPSYTGIMIGSPSETILAEAWTKGFRGFDVQEAYRAVKKNATVPQPTDRKFDWRDRGCFGDTPETRAGLGRYQTIGYVAADETRESVSRTQDFGLQDLAAAILADATGHPEDAEYFRARSFNYHNLWNEEHQMFYPRRADGSWVEEPSSYDYCECTPQTALWCVPYDVNGLVELLGGKDVFESRLDEFFETLFWVPERGNRSIHGNETSHHIAYLYNRIGVPEKTQFRVREIMSRAYSSGRKGFDGNEDCGQMSAWYILSAMGLYMLNPADGWYELGSPCVESATIHIHRPYKPATLRISTVGQGTDKYKVRRVMFNGEEIKDWRIHHSTLVKGGELVFEFE